MSQNVARIGGYQSEKVAPGTALALVGHSADIVVILDEDRRVSAARSAMGLPCEDWTGLEVAALFSTDDAMRLDAAIRGGPPTTVEHADAVGTPVPVRYAAEASEAGTILLGRDMREMAGLSSALAQAQRALRTDLDASRVAEDRLRLLLRHVSDAVVVIAARSGRIVSLSAPAAALLDGTPEALTGAAFTQCFSGRRRSEFIDSLIASSADGTRSTVTAELRGSERSIDLSTRVSGGGGETHILCSLSPRDGEPIPSGARPDILFANNADGVVCVDPRGIVLQANRAFLGMIGAMGSEAVLKRAVDVFLARGTVDLRNLRELAGAATVQTELLGLDGRRVPVEVLTTTLTHGEIALTMRDLGLSQAMWPEGFATGGPGGRAQAIDLVGTMPLRDVVARMTDLVERDCIAAALEMTAHNRVATAEMLGVSRQSLYVKLRKHGLADRGDG